MMVARVSPPCVLGTPRSQTGGKSTGTNGGQQGFKKSGKCVSVAASESAQAKVKVPDMITVCLNKRGVHGNDESPIMSAVTGL
jgi:hypothetical protein